MQSKLVKGLVVKTLSKPEAAKLEAVVLLLKTIGEMFHDESATNMAAEIEIIRKKYDPET